MAAEEQFRLRCINKFDRLGGPNLRPRSWALFYHWTTYTHNMRRHAGPPARMIKPWKPR